MNIRLYFFFWRHFSNSKKPQERSPSNLLWRKKASPLERSDQQKFRLAERCFRGAFKTRRDKERGKRGESRDARDQPCHARPTPTLRSTLIAWETSDRVGTGLLHNHSRCRPTFLTAGDCHVRPVLNEHGVFVFRISTRLRCCAHWLSADDI
ncbi:hypothetical protein AVEN_240089-1 [Araneus ventricosus]|uniref:Uncharacterized protein n=1 Tax=Araneus ventricosus TaxID=182803 RepID=A0A4Y2RMK1_ARAVE|nr:hypothetical protein AVEN_240089-1 [Araneus ventricosus]